MKTFVVACALLVSIVSPATADVIGTTADFAVFANATAAYTANAYNDPTQAPIRLWTEVEDVVLASAVLLDTDLANPALRYVTSGAGAGETVFAPGSGPTVAAGTVISSYFAYFDPVNDSALGTVTFDAPVLGIIAHTSRLPFTDFLRVAGAPYPAVPAFTNRGWEDTEWGQLSADRLTFTFNALATSPGDQFRIITAAAPVPEPQIWMLLLTGLVAVALNVWRRS